MYAKKNLIRAFVLVVILLVGLDSWPPQSWLVFIKLPVSRLNDLVGIRQGTWSMFTPNPVINNRWISADMKTVDGRTLHWDSPLWARSSTWDKFVRFRHMNYYNRIFNAWCMAGREDLMRYIARQSGEDLESIQLHLNRLELIMPEDGSFPPREEAELRLISEPWIGEVHSP